MFEARHGALTGKTLCAVGVGSWFTACGGAKWGRVVLAMSSQCSAVCDVAEMCTPSSLSHTPTGTRQLPEQRKWHTHLNGGGRQQLLH